MFIRGGYKVYPSEMEDVLARHPRIARAAIVGVPADRNDNPAELTERLYNQPLALPLPRRPRLARIAMSPVGVI
jgi:Acyl-CoA synthetases (AMP-forming)/AMP-acid ligases II